MERTTSPNKVELPYKYNRKPNLLVVERSEITWAPSFWDSEKVKTESDAAKSVNHQDIRKKFLKEPQQMNHIT